MEFNLSEKIGYHNNYESSAFITRKDVKEFIRLDWILLKKLMSKEITWSDYIKEKNKLAGSDLIKQKKERKE